MSDAKNNLMGDVMPPNEEAKAVFHGVKDDVIKRLHELKHEDNIHDFHVMDDLKKIDTFLLKQYAVEEVAYGYNYFGKIEIEENKNIHVRCHKYHDDPKNERIEFYSILTEKDETGKRTAIWSPEEPLKYFID
ncbi:hypothetical protein [Parasitella parasitica]|uniref:Cystatin domain-containing protein n=1 Tax=Parasitella parasitica TaxID=35722 RepID=A0A0B7N2A9_9FUNG|nr:hypothetical protein [Parasitella parasitica]